MSSGRTHAFMSAPVIRVRRVICAACLAAAAVLLWQAGGLTGEFARERDAARAYQRGAVLLAAGDYAAAADAFRQTLALAPRSVEAYGALAEAERRQGHVDAAVEAYRRWLAIYPYTYVGVLYRELGLIELRGQRYVDARKDFEQAVHLDARDWQAYYWLGHAHRRLGRIEEARIAWQNVVRLNPEFAPVHEQLRRLGD
jgi:tetratricopeptide (TPR) repeat protein